MKEDTPSEPGTKPVGFVIPIRPTFDKVAALWLALKALELRLEDVDVVSHSSSDPNDPFLREMVEKGYYLIDVGENKYQSRRTGSAVETVVQDFGITDPVPMSLVAIANQNNRRGNLKSYSPNINPEQGEKWEFTAPNPNRLGARSNGGKAIRNTATMNWSIVWLLRDAYKVGWDVHQILVHVHCLLDAWETIQRGQYDENRWARRVAQPGRIRRAWEMFGSPAITSVPFFSTPMLVYQLAIVGDEQIAFKTGQIEQEIQFWFSVQKSVMQERINAQEWAIRFCEEDNLRRLKDQGRLFELDNCQGTLGVFVESATEMQIRALFGQVDDSVESDLMVAIFGQKGLIGQKFGLIINRSPEGNYAILPGGRSLDFIWVFNRLRGLERQLREKQPQTETLVWHLDIKGAPQCQRHQLLNGSPGWPLPSSKIFPESVIRFVQESTYFMGQRPQPKHGGGKRHGKS